jgi:rhodanese-related sulfurtransferase
MQKAVSAPSPSRIIVDVREPSELQEMGTIPGAINIPILHNPDSFSITDAEFRERHGIERPGKDKELIFFCMAGVRSHAATGAARDRGWTKAADYPGSWNQWTWLGGTVEKLEGKGKEGGKS